MGLGTEASEEPGEAGNSVEGTQDKGGALWLAPTPPPTGHFTGTLPLARPLAQDLAQEGSRAAWLPCSCGDALCTPSLSTWLDPPCHPCGAALTWSASQGLSAQSRGWARAKGTDTSGLLQPWDSPWVLSPGFQGAH